MGDIADMVLDEAEMQEHMQDWREVPIYEQYNEGSVGKHGSVSGGPSSFPDEVMEKGGHLINLNKNA